VGNVRLAKSIRHKAAKNIAAGKNRLNFTGLPGA
jgi:hypothetical protein